MNTVNLPMYSQVFSQKENNSLFMFVATLFIKKQCYLPFLCHESYLMLVGLYIFRNILHSKAFYA
jgi:hypothetical protein